MLNCFQHGDQGIYEMIDALPGTTEQLAFRSMEWNPERSFMLTRFTSMKRMVFESFEPHLLSKSLPANNIANRFPLTLEELDMKINFCPSLKAWLVEELSLLTKLKAFSLNQQRLGDFRSVLDVLSKDNLEHVKYETWFPINEHLGLNLFRNLRSLGLITTSGRHQKEFVEDIFANLPPKLETINLQIHGLIETNCSECKQLPIGIQ